MIPIYIPSRSRYHSMKTLMLLSEELWPYTTLVVPPKQYREYRTLSPQIVHVLPFDGTGIDNKREFILRQSIEGKFIMFDDDLTLYRRSEDGRTFTRISPRSGESVDLILTISDLLDVYGYVGVVDKFMSQTRPRVKMECTRFNQILGVNRNLLPTPWPTFRGVGVNEEHNFHLQMLTRGCKTAVSTEWSKSDQPRAKGGCSDWRNDLIIVEMGKKLVDLWPGLVTIRDKEPEGMYVRFNWREAIRRGGLA